MARKCEALIIEILELLFEANAARQERFVLLKKIDLKLKILKTIIRLSFDCRAIDQKKYLYLEKALQEIGKMLGGWIKSLKNPAV